MIHLSKKKKKKIHNSKYLHESCQIWDGFFFLGGGDWGGDTACIDACFNTDKGTQI